RTIAMNALVAMEVIYLLFIRNLHTTSLTWNAVRGTRAVWLTIFIVAIGQFAITWLPFMQAIFATAPIPLDDGLLILGTALIILVILEMEKQLRLRWFSKRVRARERLYPPA